MWKMAEIRRVKPSRYRRRLPNIRRTTETRRMSSVVFRSAAKIGKVAHIKASTSRMLQPLPCSDDLFSGSCGYTHAFSQELMLIGGCVWHNFEYSNDYLVLNAAKILEYILILIDKLRMHLLLPLLWFFPGATRRTERVKMKRIMFSMVDSAIAMMLKQGWKQPQTNRRCEFGGVVRMYVCVSCD